MKVDLYNRAGSKTGDVELNESVFGIEPNEHVMHLSIVNYLENQRQGTRKTKVRHEVSGGGKKPWSQKGRGTARAGSTRSPIWVGGGTIHGPKPYDYGSKLPKKVSQLGRKSAYSLRVKEENVKVVEDFTFDQAKTKDMAELLRNLDVKTESTLVITSSNDTNLWLSSRNIPKLNLKSFDRVSTYDLLSHKKVVILQSAIKNIEDSFAK